MTLDLHTRRAFRVAAEMAREEYGAGREGFGVATLLDARGRVIDTVPFHNLITDAGDLYCAQALIRGSGPANPGAPSPGVPNGMKLGTGSTAVSKAGAGAALVTYVSGSNVAFDTGYAQTADLGSGLGKTSIWKTTWGAGVATNGALTEAVIVNDQASNLTSTAANTYARTLFGSSINKQSGDTLAVTWAWKNLGA